MILVYVAFFFMLLAAISLIGYPYLKNKSYKHFIFVASFLILFSVGLYQYIRPVGLADWLSHGNNHYELMVQLNQLGGITGIIDKVKVKLAKNPNDIKGWLMLHKLYLMENDQQNAALALKQAERMMKKS